MNYRITVSCFAALCIAGASQASLTLLTDRSLVNAQDMIDWSQFGPPITLVGNNLNGVTEMGGAFNVTGPSAGMEIVQQGAFVGDFSGGWGGNFNPNDHVLWTAGNTGPITLTFGETQVSMGMQVQEDFYGAFTATLTAYDGLNNLLGTVTENGVSNGNADGSAIFLGALSSSKNIGKVVIDVTGINGEGDFAVNQVSLHNCGTVPEPASFAVLGIGAVAMLRRRRN